MIRPLITLAIVSSALAEPASRPISFSKEIRPILSENCYFCHGPDEKKREAGLRLDDETSSKKSNDGVIAVVPGNPDKSALIERIVSKDPDEVMPPPKQHKTISPVQVALLKEWIKQGAKWGKHWSYEKVVRPQVPAGAKNPVDAFLVQRLTQEGLKFSPEADVATLIRRVALDLTGLPPTLEELNTLAKQSHDKIVAHYLNKPAYGEHWARQWLDLARYADSSGYPSDQPREIWAYRDWVIRALNTNMPFDQFTIEQNAGDLLPKPTDDQLIATAFHRNTMTQNEGGTDDEEFRNAAVIDRVNTTFAVWMGTTMACAQCHTHKYDPITINEYFQFYAFLNQSADSDKKDEVPLHSFDTPELKQQRERLKNEIDTLEKKFTTPEAAWLAGLAAWDTGFARDLGWQTPKPVKATAKMNEAATIRDDGSVLIAKNSDTNIYTVEVPATGDKLSALRLETIPATGFGNFVITDLKAEVVPPATKAAPSARYVRIELPGDKKTLQLAEVQAFSGKDNIALKGVATQSSLYTDAAAKRANDGNTEGNYAKGSVAHTSGSDNDPWWEVDLKAAQAIDRIVVWNRTDGSVGKRLDGFHVVLLDDKRQIVWKSASTPGPDKDKTFAVAGPVPVSFTTAIADYEQTGFTAASVLKSKDKTNQGWGIGGATDKPHALTLLAPSPVVVPPGSTLRVTIAHNSEFKQHTLGSFRLGFTGDARVQQVTKVPQNIIAALVAQAKRTPEQQKAVTDYYVRNVAKESATERTRVAAANKELAAIKPLTVPIMRDLDPKQRRVTKIQLRGNWQALDAEVSEATPAVFNPLPANAPRNRLTMAQWLVSRDNPLTARVTVNRLWESIFGTGIVRSSEEFGSQGDLPFHPELLDWLAAELMDSGWDIKHMLKLMLTSEAYRQSSKSTPELNDRDPDNRLLARGPRFRPTGELLRDQALAVSGLLSEKMFGVPVRPVTPNMGLSTAFGRSNDWEVSKGEDAHRRSLYTEVRRNSPYASFTTFDAGNREVCMIRRSRTNTPLQAFVTLNDPVFIETHQAMARRIVREAKSTSERLIHLFKLCLSREPIAHEVTALTQLHAESLAAYQKDPAAAAKMATEPLGPAEAGSDIAELAAWTAVANVVMNLDEFLMRR
ncbi:DUF1553 domain-containing protein [Prosthecobacter sp.]|uniref:DUF1553 domain-containing protein n=1 Tax=Prosthecobacter sp. TaxID=1965333 RepID=UPI002AB81CC5|nr:DUF1553 domain-containing protein [Prosthecobacter sp.]MDZ4402251.1 DUF1553 domain-containing protein [Prosthecobacter sp.]